MVVVTHTCLTVGEGFAPLPQGELLLLCLPKEEVTKKKGHPARRPPQLRCCGSV